MKRIFLSIALLCVIVCSATTEPVIVPHVSEPVITTHVSEVEVHTAPVHETVETPTYSHETVNSEYFQSQPGVYCYLLYNNHTRVYDTIKAKSKEELKYKVESLTSPQNEKLTPKEICVILGFVIAFIIAVLYARSVTPGVYEDDLPKY